MKPSTVMFWGMIFNLVMMIFIDIEMGGLWFMLPVAYVVVWAWGTIYFETIGW